MGFLAWHYSSGVKFYLKRYFFALIYINHYFSLTVLPFTLLSPWKRLVEIKERPGFDFKEAFERISYNLVSRFVGAFVRAFLLIAGLLIFIFVLIFGAMGLIVWVLVPLLSINLYLIQKKQPKSMVNYLVEKMILNPEIAIKILFENEAGRFVLGHLGMSFSDFSGAVKMEKVNVEKYEAENYEGLMKQFVESGAWEEEFFRTNKFRVDDLLLACRWWDKQQYEKTKIAEMPEIGKPGIGLELLYGYTPTLNKYSVDLSLEQDFSHHLIGRANVVKRMERVLGSGNSVILNGPAGVGKKTVVLEFARKASLGQLGSKMAYRRVMELDFSFLFSESTDLSKKKALLATILAEASTAGNIIIVMRDLHRVTNAELEGLDFTDIFERFMEKRELLLIAIATGMEHERFISRNGRLKKYFELVEVEQPSASEALQILVDSAESWERKRNIKIGISAIRKIMEGSERYVTDTPYPEKALELLDAVVIYAEQKGEKELVAEELVNNVLSERTGISFARLTESEKKKLTNLEEHIHEHLVDQVAAVTLISQILRGKSVGVTNNNRPIGSLLFLGPTGVGKTETAKVLADVYFGSAESILRFDMAEYSGIDGLSRLIGNTNGNQPGRLTTAITNKPASLLLLDELEKASGEVNNIFLSLLDEGVITDAFDKKVRCGNLFVVGTSNAGAEYIRKLVEKGVLGDELHKQVIEYVMEQRIFSPEFINRFDGVVVYEPLGKEELEKIARIKLSKLSAELRLKNILVEFDESAIQKLAEEGYEPAFGARPMRRIIEIHIGDMIGKGVLSEEIKQGEEIVVFAGKDKNEFSWRVQ